MNLLTWLVTLAITGIPVLANYAVHRYLHRTFTISVSTLLLPLACSALYPIARYLPEPQITNESATLVQHFVGGGFISALYFLYFLREFRIKLPLLVYFMLLYPFVSMMGVTNELLEFTATKLHLYVLDGSDVWWDLLANTFGAFTLFTAITIILKLLNRPLTRTPVT